MPQSKITGFGEPLSTDVDSSGRHRLRVWSDGGIPGATSATILSATTAAGGTTFVAFGSQACSALDVVNNSGVTIEIRRDGAGVAIPLLPGQARLFVGIANANQLGVRRLDQSTTQVTVHGEALVA